MTTVQYNHHHGKETTLGSRQHHVATSPKRCRSIFGVRDLLAASSRRVKSVEDRTHRHRNHHKVAVCIKTVAGPKCAIIKWIRGGSPSWWLYRIWLISVLPVHRHVLRWSCLQGKGKEVGAEKGNLVFSSSKHLEFYFLTSCTLLGN